MLPELLPTLYRSALRRHFYNSLSICSSLDCAANHHHGWEWHWSSRVSLTLCCTTWFFGFCGHWPPYFWILTACQLRKINLICHFVLSCSTASCRCLHMPMPSIKLVISYHKSYCGYGCNNAMFSCSVFSIFTPSTFNLLLLPPRHSSSHSHYLSTKTYSTKHKHRHISHTPFDANRNPTLICNPHTTMKSTINIYTLIFIPS